MKQWTRRDVLAAVGAAAAATALTGRAPGATKESNMRVGLVTYLWARDWDLETILAHCRAADIGAVELRSTHKHGVEPDLPAARRAEVKKRFADSGVTFLGPGSAECFDHPDADRLARAVEDTKAFVKLSHDCGGSGVKVRPNKLHKDVPHAKTIEQIGRSLNVVGKYAADFGQEIRLEVHGDCARWPICRQIMDHVTEPAVRICWNSNAQDLRGKGLEHNFNLVKDVLGATVHIRAFDTRGCDYPWGKLVALLDGIGYDGWLCLECSDKRKDVVAAMARQPRLLAELLAAARKGNVKP